MYRPCNVLTCSCVGLEMCKSVYVYIGLVVNRPVHLSAL